MAERFYFSLPARLEYRDAAREFIEFLLSRLIEQKRITAPQKHRLSSAFVEAFNNSVLHGSSKDGPGAPPKQVDIAFELRPHEMELSFRDEGPPYALRGPEELEPSEDLEPDLKEHGMGLQIIQSFMDEVSYQRLDHKNELRMRLFFESQPEAKEHESKV